VAVLVIALLTWVDCRGVESGKWVQNVFTVAKTLGLILLIVMGLTVAANPEAIAANLSDVWGGITGTAQFERVSKFMPVTALAVVMVICGAMVGSLFSADAWNNVTFTAGEIKNPRRNLPLSLFFGTVVVIGLYLLANLAYLAALPLGGNEPETLRLEAEIKRHQATAALHEAEAAKLLAEMAQDRLELHQLKAAAADWKKQGRTQVAEESAALAAITEKKVEAAQKEVDRLLAAAAEERREARALEADVAAARGINSARDDRVGTAVLERASPNVGVPLMAFAIMLSTFGCVNGITLMGARLYYAMSQDRLFFRSVGTLNHRGVPAVGLVLQAVWSILLVFSGSYNELLDYVIWAALFFYVLTVAGLFILRRTRPDAPRPYRAFGYPVIPALYVLLCAVIMLALLIVKPVFSWPSFLIVLTGIPVYFLWRGRGSSPTGSAP
jgi:amino acid transporter